MNFRLQNVVKSNLMKLKHFILLFISLWAIGCCHAQLRYGFRLGGEFVKFSLDGAPEYSLSNRSGFTGGLMLEYQFEKNGFAPDIAVTYARYNSRLVLPDGNPRSFGRNFIDIPLRFKYKFWLKSSHYLFAPLIYTGPVVSFRLDHNDATPLKTDLMQPGWDVGLGIDAINFIQITAGYRFGLGNAVKDFIGFPDAVLRTNGWNLTVNLLFDF